MKKLLTLILLGAALTFNGCIMPKPIEFGQDKVRAFPTAKAKEKEVQRQVAQRAAVKADETFKAAIATEAEPSVIAPAAEATVLTEAVSTSLGPPSKPAPDTVTSQELARQLDTAVAKLNSRLESFKEDNNENAGKKIEGTGIFSMSYISYLLIMVVVLIGAVVLFSVVKAALKVYAATNPAVGLGMSVVQTGGKVAAKGFSQLLKGGENFKNSIGAKIPELDAALQAKVLEHFRQSHESAHDEDVQHVIQVLTKK